jgi:phenylpropionate dioxygenase-like ring-hydroxylating dioxygenase large terminal subunit
MRKLKDTVRQAIQHMEAGTLELGPAISSCLVSDFADPELFRQEISKVLGSGPLSLVASEEISHPGDFITRELNGVSLLATRQESGEVKVFLNVCRHRGAKLVVSCKGNNSTFTCPFHGWVYGQEGELIQIPAKAACFPTISDSAFKLKEIPSAEFAGMIWVFLNGPKAGAFAQLTEDFPLLGFEPTHALPEFSIVGGFNWKIGVEAFLEVYHFTHTHAPYLAELPHPNLSLRDIHERNCRILVPLRIPAAGEPLLAWSQAMYFLFPATFLLFYDDHVALISIEPISLNRTRLRIIPLVPNEAAKENQEILGKIEFLKVIVAQDLAVMEDLQKGLASGANSRFTFTRLETALGDFHANIKDALK